MASNLPVSAIFDIGKTNKKFLLFDREYTVVYERKTGFNETVDEDGFPCDDIKQISAWVLAELANALKNGGYRIESVNVSAYGATLVHLDESGKPCTPLYNYLKPFPEELAAEFYRTVDGRETFSLETASPPMGMLNSGLQLWWLKHQKPEAFQNVMTTLHLPQYIAYLFSKYPVSELTSIGCHTAMWNFQKNSYHSWLNHENLLQQLPPVHPAHTTMEISFRGSIFHAGVGIHDSSASLVPYLATFQKPFIQLSTGTWSVAMNPFSADPLTFDELRRDCLQYLNIRGKPVKASRFLLGGEYSNQLKKLGGHFGKNPETFDCKPDPGLIKKLLENPAPEKCLVLEKASGSGPYQTKKPGQWNLNLFKNYEEAAHQCLLDLAAIQADSIKLAEGSTHIGQVIITGGFARNPFFCRLLATWLPGKKLFTASLSDASALGAAVLMKPEQTASALLKERLRLETVEPYPGLKTDQYSWASSRIS